MTYCVPLWISLFSNGIFLGRMPQRKIGKHTKEQMKFAFKAVEENMSIRKAAKKYEIVYPTFRRYVLFVKDCRQVAFEMVKEKNLKMPSTLLKDLSFKQRHTDIVVKKTRTVSLAGATAFTQKMSKYFMTTYKLFYRNKRNLLMEHAYLNWTKLALGSKNHKKC